VRHEWTFLDAYGRGDVPPPTPVESTLCTNCAVLDEISNNAKTLMDVHGQNARCSIHRASSRARSVLTYRPRSVLYQKQPSARAGYAFWVTGEVTSKWITLEAPRAFSFMVSLAWVSGSSQAVKVRKTWSCWRSMALHSAHFLSPFQCAWRTAAADRFIWR